MEIELRWKELMAFDAKVGPHIISMDAKTPIGKYTAPTPKELLVSALCGCTAMDVVGLLRKFRQELNELTIKAHVSIAEKSHPAVFTAVKLDLYMQGKVEPARALEAVQLSQTQFCGISAMLVKAFPITWEVFVNEESVGSGQAAF